MKSLNEIYNVFSKNFLSATILYLPLHIVELYKKEKDKAVLRPLSNKMFLIEFNLHNYFIDDKNQHCVIHIMNKNTLLDDNTYRLLTFKEEESVSTFNFILEKYLEQLEGYVFISNWFYLNASSDIENLTNEVMVALKLQYNYFKAHQEDVLRRFESHQKRPVEINFENLSQGSLKTLGELIKDRNLKKVIKSNPIIVNRKENKKVHLEKLKEQTSKNADELILAKVFGLMLESNN